MLAPRAGVVQIMWQEIQPYGCVYWYELQLLNVVYGNFSLITSGVATVELEELHSLDLYHFSVRACDVGACGAWSAPLALVPARPDSLFGPTAVTAAGYVEGLLTVSWVAEAWDREPFLDTFQVLAASEEEGPYVDVGVVPASAAPQLSFACNETNMSNALWPSAIYVKVIARVATQWSTEAMAAESAARIGSVPRAKELLGG
ncbi:unnamed protein product, partial [Durusdinium trenchii]